MKIFSKAKLIRYVLRNEGVPVEFHFLAVGKEVDKVKNYFFFQKGEKKDQLEKEDSRKCNLESFPLPQIRQNLLMGCNMCSCPIGYIS